MRRHLATFSFFFSLLLCVTVGLLWLRSVVTSDSLRYETKQHSPGYLRWRQVSLDSDRGEFVFQYYTAEYVSDVPWAARRIDAMAAGDERYAFAHLLGHFPRATWKATPLGTERFSHPYGTIWLTGKMASEEPTWATRLRRLGFHWAASPREPLRAFDDPMTLWTTVRAVGAPYWFVLLLTAILPARRLRRWLAMRSRLRKGLCRSCGYDLRGSPDRCPECGAAESGKTKMEDGRIKPVGKALSRP